MNHFMPIGFLILFLASAGVTVGTLTGSSDKTKEYVFKKSDQRRMLDEPWTNVRMPLFGALPCPHAKRANRMVEVRSPLLLYAKKALFY